MKTLTLATTVALTTLLFTSNTFAFIGKHKETPVKTDTLVYLNNTFTKEECYATFKYPLKKGEKFLLEEITYKGNGKVDGYMFRYHGTEVSGVSRWYWGSFFEEGVVCNDN